MKKLFAGLFVALLIALGGNLAAQNIPLIGAFYQFSGLGVGMAPNGATGAVNAPIYSWPAVGAVLPNAATLTPTIALHHVTGGITVVNTIAVPTTCNGPGANTTCQIVLIPDTGVSMPVSTTATGGNIWTGTVGVTNRALTMTWDGIGWNPSY